MDTQTQLAETLYGLLETQEDPQEIMDILPQIDDLNRWNINITGIVLAKRIPYSYEFGSDDETTREGST